MSIKKVKNIWKLFIVRILKIIIKITILFVIYASLKYSVSNLYPEMANKNKIANNRYIPLNTKRSSCANLENR